MSNTRSGAPGATRSCPHCRETILESAAICPACRHHLRFDEQASANAPAAQVPLKVDGGIQHPSDSEPAEYTVVVTVSNDRGEEIARRLVSVGALMPGDRRSFSLRVEVVPARARGRNSTRH